MAINEGGSPEPIHSRFGFFARLVGNHHIALMVQLSRGSETSHWATVMAKLENIERLIASFIEDSQDRAALEAALADLQAADTVIDNIEPTQGVPQ